MSWNPFDKAKDAVRKIIDPAVRRGKGALSDTFGQLSRELKRKGERIEGGLKTAAHAAEEGIEEARDSSIARVRSAGAEIEETIGERVPELVTEKLPEVLEDAGKAAYDAAMGPFGDAAVALVKCGANGTDAFQIGPVAVTVDNAGDKIDAIRKYIADPPNWKDRSEVLRFVNVVLPSSLTIGLSLKGVALVITSNALEVAYSKTWTTEKFLEDLDEVIETFERIL